MTALAASILAGGFVVLLVSIPLISRKIPMNPIYGVRVGAAFESNENWYAINEYGGRLLARAACVFILIGIAGFLISARWLEVYAWTSLVVVTGVLIVIGFSLARWIKRNIRSGTPASPTSGDR